MKLPPDFLLARPLTEPWPLREDGEPLRVGLASLAMGGAERIVLDWLEAEARRGRAVELALFFPRRQGFEAPPGLHCIERGREPLAEFAQQLCHRWRDSTQPVSTHLLPDSVLEQFWAAGIATVPVVHNTREAWRNDPRLWRAPEVPLAVACAGEVARQLEAAGATVPIAVIRHVPRVGPRAFDAAERARLRQDLGIGAQTLLIVAVGALRPQKDYARAIAVLAETLKRRDAALLILGGALDAAGLTELDRLLEAAVRLQVSDRLRLPGFVDPVDPWYAASDAFLNVSRHEGFSMATREALAAGLPAFTTRVGGQHEIAHPALQCFAPDAPAAEFAPALARLRPREALPAQPALLREPRAWSVSLAARRPAGSAIESLFVTANLNAGGAQRSLVNLLRHWPNPGELALAVCASPTHGYFSEALRGRGIECFRAARSGDPIELARGVLGFASERRVRRIVLWNVDAKLKRLLAAFAPPQRVLIDVSPGAYAFAEMEASAEFARALGIDVNGFAQRLDALVLKYDAQPRPAARQLRVIPNGVARRPLAPLARAPVFLVSGRIAPSKSLEIIIEALRTVAREIPDVSLDIFGQAEPRHAAYLEALKASVAALPIRFRGAAPALEFLSEPYRAAIVLGEHQGCPNAVLEALSAGIPVIANASGGTAAILNEGPGGWLLPEEPEVESLAAALREAAANPATARRRGRLGRVGVRRRYGMAAMVAGYQQLFSAHDKR